LSVEQRALADARVSASSASFLLYDLKNLGCQETLLFLHDYLLRFLHDYQFSDVVKSNDISEHFQTKGENL
jgi:hypothetical protein